MCSRVIPIVLFLLLPLSAVFSQGSVNNCNNIDFESANFSNWDGLIGCPDRGFKITQALYCTNTWNGIDPDNGVDDAGTAAGLESQHEIISQGFNGGKDPIVNALSIKSPLLNGQGNSTGTYVARLGNYEGNPSGSGVSGTGVAQAAELSYNITVDSSNLIIQVAYAVVLESPGHAYNELPYFSINVLDPNDQKIECMRFEVAGTSSEPGFKRFGGYVWKDWTIASLYLGDYFGSNVTVQFQTSDCYLEAHAGWAYVDAHCDSLKIEADKDSICVGEFFNIEAPKGMTNYKWYYVPDSVYEDNKAYYDNIPPGNFGSTGAIDTMFRFTEFDASGVPIVGRKIKHNRPGYYFVEMEPFTTSNTPCPFRMMKKIHARPEPDPGFITEFEPFCQGTPIFVRDTSPNPDSSKIEIRKWMWDLEQTGGVPKYIYADTFYHAEDTVFEFIDNKLHLPSENYSNIAVIPDTSGKISFGMVLINQFGCKDTLFKEIEITPIDTIVFEDPAILCVDEPPLQLVANPKDGEWNGDSLVWSGPGVSKSGILDPAEFDGNFGRHWVYLTQYPCMETDSLQVEIQDRADADFDAPEELCPEDYPLTLSANNPNGVWSGKYITPGGYYNPVGAPAGFDSVYYRIAGQCPDTVGKAILLLRAPAFNFEQIGAQCEVDVDIALNMEPAGGTWSGTGIVDADNGIWNPNTAGLGEHNIRYTITDPCFKDTTVVLEVIANPDPSFTAPDTLCNDVGAFDLKAAQSGGIWSGPGIINPTKGTFDPDAANPGENEVEYSFNGSCAKKDSALIFIIKKQIPVLDEEGPFCLVDTMVQLNTSVEGGTWSGNGITDPENGVFNPIVSDTGRHTITYDFSINGFCPTFDEIVIEVTNKTPVGIQAPNSSYCDSDDAFNLVGSPANGVWSGTGITDQTLGTFDPAKAGEGMHRIYYQVPGICGGIDSVDIQVIKFQQANLDPQGPLCPDGNPVELLFSPAGGSFNSSFVSESGGKYFFDPTAAGTGMHNIQYSLPGQCGSDTTIQVEVAPALNIQSLSGTNPSCFGFSDGSITLNASGGYNNITYSYNPAPISGQGSNSATGFSSGKVVITLSDDLGCQLLDSVTLTQPPALSFGINLKSENCGKADAEAEVINLNGGTPGYGFNWLNSSSDSAKSVNRSAGPVRITITDSQGCELSLDTVITGSPAPIFNIAAQPVSCKDSTDGSVSVSNIQNTLGPISHTLNGNNQNNLTAFNLAPGNYTWVLTDSVGCTANRTVEVTEPSAVVIALPYHQDSICINENPSISPSINGGNGAPFSFAWSKDGSVVYSQAQLTYNDSGSYFVQGFDANNCPSNMEQLDVHYYPPLDIIASANPSIICSGDLTQLSGSALGGNSNYIYTWRDNNNNILSQNATTSAPAYGDSASTGYFLFEVSDACSPPAIDTVFISFHPEPRPLALPDSSCAPLNATLIDISATATKWVWEGNGQSLNGNNAQLSNLPPGNYNIRLYSENQFGCKDTSTFSSLLKSFRNPIASVRVSPNYVDINTVQVLLNNTDNADVESWSWQIIDLNNPLDTIFTNQRNPSFDPGSDTTRYLVNLWLESARGCRDSTFRIIPVKPAHEVFVPNTFSPNGDGANDYFFPVFFGLEVQGYVFQIFDRWGELIFKSVELDKGWDGKYMGESVKPGVYVWKLKYLNEYNEEKSLFGNVNVLR
ncbi:MAG: gliding motility-associated C-terminal domain-containing protein [Luteibaculum sp.]